MSPARQTVFESTVWICSCEIGNKLTEEEQWKKLALVKEIAEEVWGEEK